MSPKVLKSLVLFGIVYVTGRGYQNSFLPMYEGYQTSILVYAYISDWSAGVGFVFQRFQLDVGIDVSDLVNTFSISTIYGF